MEMGYRSRLELAGRPFHGAGDVFRFAAVQESDVLTEPWHDRRLHWSLGDSLREVAQALLSHQFGDALEFLLVAGAQAARYETAEIKLFLNRGAD